MPSKNSSILSVRVPNETMEQYLRLLELSGEAKKDFIKDLLVTWEKEHTKWDDTETSRR